MKTIKYLVAVCVFLVSFSSCTEKQKSVLQKEGLRGKVKSYTLYWYEVLEGKKGRELLADKKEYNEDGKLIKEIKTEKFQDTNVMELKYNYDKKGYLVEMKGYDKDSLIDVITFKNDKKGHCIEANSTVLGKTIYKNDENGNPIEKKMYQGNDLQFIYYFKYDKKGNEIEVKWCRADGNLMDKYEYEYDESGNVIKQRKYRMDNDSLKLTSEIKNKYEFDKKGNWVKQVCSQNEQIFSILERKYEYYE
ncbi:MAG: hypothetical protein KGV44_01125 [Flavobacteriaceae bacterium]|nr:hypothetical protein [Flavobacteriaceae bacterium]